LANKILPKDNKLPHSHREVSSIMKDIGMEYKTYDACPNDHILYYGENANLQQCPMCHTNRYRQDQVSKKVPYKVLRHIPLKPRFERMFKCKELAKWHLHSTNTSLIHGIFIPLILLIKMLCCDSCMQSPLTTHHNHYPPIGIQMFQFASGQVSYAISARKEWFRYM